MRTTLNTGPNGREPQGAIPAETPHCRRSGFSAGLPRRSGYIVLADGERRASILSLLLAASRKLYVYLHIDTESLTNGELPDPHPSIFVGNFPSFACHSWFVILADGISDERVCEVSA